MTESLEIIFRSFWTFFGTLLLISVITMPFKWFFRSRNIKHQGWPTGNVDADGEFPDWYKSENRK